ncbi:hypothetical protein VTL71DRAFT_12254 [Oculimacula yallundae]|uniref:Uncharacterized protein n=1 Tax=Oculimacula yallundae TaxID=86028 RepID=A0ABR4CSH6_9HELO
MATILKLREIIGDDFYRDDQDPEEEDILSPDSPGSRNPSSRPSSSHRPSSPHRALSPRRPSSPVQPSSPTEPANHTLHASSPIRIPSMDEDWPEDTMEYPPEATIAFDFNRRDFSLPKGLSIDDRLGTDHTWNLPPTTIIKKAKTKRWMEGRPDNRGPQCLPGYEFVASDYPV